MLSGVWFDALFTVLLPLQPPPLTLENVLKAVERVRNWERLCGARGLGVNTFDIQRQHESDEAFLKAVVEKFLLGEGYYQPSWRRVIYSLDLVDESHLADQIRSYGEPVQGESTCTCVYLKVVTLVYV